MGLSESGISAMKWDHSNNPWRSEHVEIDAHVAWQMKRCGLSPDNDELQLLALLELAPGIDAKKFQASLRDPPFAQFSKQVFIRKAWLEVLNDTGIALDEGGFITAMVTPHFVAGIARLGLEAAKLLRGLTIAHDADAGPEHLDSDPELLFAFRIIPDESPTSVIMGIIDDALPLAHPRFRESSESGGGTRWKSVWLQGEAVAKEVYGSQLDERRINQAQHGTTNETAIMERLGQITGVGEEGSRLRRRIAHGFHVADLMAGFEPDNPAGASRPLIGVQLPTTSSRDATGLSLAPYVIDALVFILSKAKNISALASSRLPIVVNLSYGVFTGAHDGSSLLERALSHMVDTCNRTFPDAPFILTLPAGNTLQSRAHAHLQFDEAGAADPLAWRILPDSKASALLDVCWSEGSAGGDVTITPPGGPSVTVSAGKPFAELTLENGSLIAQASFRPHSGNTHRAMASIAVAPTLAAPHGLWTIAVSGGAGEDAHIWIGRGDTPFGFARRGRQSRFEDAEYELTDAFGALSMEDSDGARIRRGGSLNGMATALSQNIVVVGAWNDHSGQPSPYSSAGYPLRDGTETKRVRPPDIAATADQGRTLEGILASGIAGGSFVALNGTSVAAPLAARAIADSLLAQIPVNKATTPKKPGKKIAADLASKAGRGTKPVVEALAGAGPIASGGDSRLRELAALRRR
jgi:hypothetical protein